MGNLPTPMDKDSSKNVVPGGARRWNLEHTAYVCADGAKVQVQSRSARLLSHDSEDKHDKATCVSEIFYSATEGKAEMILMVSLILLDRNMSQIVLGLPEIKTITFPSTVRTV